MAPPPDRCGHATLVLRLHGGAHPGRPCAAAGAAAAERAHRLWMRAARRHLRRRRGCLRAVRVTGAAEPRRYPSSIVLSAAECPAAAANAATAADTAPPPSDAASAPATFPEPQHAMLGGMRRGTWCVPGLLWLGRGVLHAERASAESHGAESLERRGSRRGWAVGAGAAWLAVAVWPWHDWLPWRALLHRRCALPTRAAALAEPATSVDAPSVTASTTIATLGHA